MRVYLQPVILAAIVVPHILLGSARVIALLRQHLGLDLSGDGFALFVSSPFFCSEEYCFS